MDEVRLREGHRGHGSFAAWAGVLVGPLAWAAQLYGNWAMGEVIACAPASDRAGSLLGLSVSGAAAIWNGVLLALTLGSLALAGLHLRTLRRGGDRSPAGRERWLARAGVMTAVLFSILIAASFIPIAMVRGCG
ncbi:MAG TPA: hypothetical protein VE669_05745 [Actinomycetota bacterium]|jgi:hypothetical protein|nr:hypothetical protein [Actinomycetota bacterium]